MLLVVPYLLCKSCYCVETANIRVLSHGQRTKMIILPISYKFKGICCHVTVTKLELHASLSLGAHICM